VRPYVVCVGLATLDTILAVPQLPGADDRVWATEHAVAGGGPAATAAVALSRLGVPVLLLGAVGDDAAGDAIRAGLEPEGVDISELAVVPGARSPQASILVTAGDASRTIAAFLGTLPPLELSERARELCRGAAWVHVDQTGYSAARAAGGDAPLSVDGGNPIDDLELEGVALFAPSEPALRSRFPGLELEAAARAALDDGAELVVVTRGSEGCLAAKSGGGLIEAPGLQVDAVSTLGAGDVFHGALLAQLVGGAALEDALAAANACAALSCRALDGRSAIPSADELAALESP
jgi:sulfofructose kinase